MDVLSLISDFRFYPGLKMTFEHNSVHKNPFLSASFCWNSRLSLREKDQKFPFVGFIGYGNSYLDSVFRYSKVFRLHAILHDAAEIELTKQMTDQEDNLYLGKIVFDDNNQERKSWSCLGQTCSRLLIVFLSQLFVILLIIFGCFWRIHLSKTCDESTVCVGILSSAAGYILRSPRL